MICGMSSLCGDTARATLDPATRKLLKRFAPVVRSVGGHRKFEAATLGLESQPRCAQAYGELTRAVHAQLGNGICETEHTRAFAPVAE